MNRPLATAGSSVRASIGYLGAYKDVPEINLSPSNSGVDPETCSTDLREVEIHGVRAQGVAPRLDQEGFTFLRDPLPAIDFACTEQIREHYYPVAERLALKATSGQAAFVFDHLIRERDPSANLHRFGERGATVKAGALGRVHNDYSEASGNLRLSLVEEAFGKNIRPRRYCIVNLWRSIGGVIEDAPLAFCSADSISTQDLVPSKLHYGHRTGEIYLVKHSEHHQWWYQEDMDVEDVAIFKQFDSKVSAGARIVPHSAFELPDAAQAKRSRKSIEVRVLVVLE